MRDSELFSPDVFQKARFLHDLWYDSNILFP